MEIRVSADKTKAVVEEAFWLAWQACNGTTGMGFLRDNPAAKKEAVLRNIAIADDYFGLVPSNKPGEMSCDYVFGRMMKMHVKFDEKTGVITVDDGKVSCGSHSWGRKYPTYEDVIKAAIVNVG